MNGQRLVAALCFALLCSGLLTWQLSRHMTHAAPSAVPVVPARTVVVAAKGLAIGETLTAPALTTVTLPAATLLPGLFSKPQELAGRVLLVPVSPGEPINTHDLAGPEAKHGLADNIPDGMRAVSIPATDQLAGSSGLVTPGSRVDILVSYRSDSDATFVSSMVLQNVRVLGSGQKEPLGAEPKLPSVDTMRLLVTPDEAARLTVASSLGKLTFALRNGTDTAVTPGLSHVTLSPAQNQGQKALTYTPPTLHKALSQHSANDAFTVETLSGGKSSIQTFQEGQQ